MIVAPDSPSCCINNGLCRLCGLIRLTVDVPAPWVLGQGVVGLSLADGCKGTCLSAGSPGFEAHLDPVCLALATRVP